MTHPRADLHSIAEVKESCHGLARLVQVLEWLVVGGNLVLSQSDGAMAPTNRHLGFLLTEYPLRNLGFWACRALEYRPYAAVRTISSTWLGTGSSLAGEFEAVTPT